MSRREKLIERICSKPTDFSWAELVKLMESFGFRVHLRGGSARKFIHTATAAVLMMHEPHPQSILKAYQVRAAVEFLKSEGYIQ